MSTVYFKRKLTAVFNADAAGTAVFGMKASHAGKLIRAHAPEVNIVHTV